MTLYEFRGGLRLDEPRLGGLGPELKTADLAANKLLEMPIPQALAYSLFTREGKPRRPALRVGQKIMMGTNLFVDDGYPVAIASAAGVVTEINKVISLTPDLSNPDATDPQSSQQFTGVNNQTSLIRALELAGLCGHGGASFASARKLLALGEDATETLIINAAECEPLINCDQTLIRHYAFELVQGINSLCTLTDCKVCLIGIEDCMEEEIVLLQQALTQYEDNAQIKLIAVPTIYPTGSERQLIRVLTGKYVPAGGRPADMGILCFNAGTVFAIHKLLSEHQVYPKRIVSVTGTAMTKSVNVLTRFGTKLKDLLEFVSPGVCTDSLDHYSLISGGSLSGHALDDWDAPVTTATNCIQLNRKVNHSPASPCIRCGYCNDVCPENLIPQQLLWFCEDRNLVDADRFNLDVCIECGCCDKVCPSNIPLTNIFRKTKQLKQEQTRLSLLADQAKERSDSRNLRLVRKETERAQRRAARQREMESARGNKPSALDIKASLARARKKKPT